MISKTKYALSDKQIKLLFSAAGLEPVTAIAPLGAGEFNAVYAVTANGAAYVLKVAPADDAPTLIYEKGMMEAEVFWYEQMRTHTGIRVPRVYFQDFSRKLIPTDYFIMERIPGKTLDQMKFSEADKKKAAGEVAKMAAALHTIKNDKFGYIQNQLHDNWYLALRASVENLLRDCEKKGKKSKRGKKMLQLIDRHRAVLEQAECCMVNFDLGDPNIMCHEKNGGYEFAWIDPERSFWGDRIADFVCLEMMTPSLAGKKAVRSAYNAAASQPVLATKSEEIRFALALAYMGMIMETEKYYRYTPHHFGWWRNVAACAFLFHSAFRALKA